MKHLFLLQPPAAAVEWLLYMNPVLRAFTVSSSLCVCLPDVFPAHRLGLVPWQAHDQALSQQGLVNPNGLARSGWRVGAVGSVVEPWCDSKALLSKSFWKGIHGKALENLCLQHKLLLQPPALPLNSHPHSLKMMCNLCGKCRFNNQSEDSFMSTRAWFILLNVCSHVGSIQRCEFGTGSFCLFPYREWNSVVLFFLSFFPSPCLPGGGGTEVQIFVFPGLTRFYTVLRALSLFSCLTALSTLKHRRNFKVSHLRNKTMMNVAGG